VTARLYSYLRHLLDHIESVCFVNPSRVESREKELAAAKRVQKKVLRFFEECLVDSTVVDLAEVPNIR
jgi:hypothetical protein